MKGRTKDKTGTVIRRPDDGWSWEKDDGDEPSEPTGPDDFDDDDPPDTGDGRGLRADRLRRLVGGLMPTTQETTMTERQWYCDTESENGCYGIYWCREDGEPGDTVCVVTHLHTAQLLVTKHNEVVAPKTLIRSPRGENRREVEIKDVTVPDLWHIIEALQSGDVVRVANGKPIHQLHADAIKEVWYLCHDLLRHVRGV